MFFRVNSKTFFFVKKLKIQRNLNQKITFHEI